MLINKIGEVRAAIPNTSPVEKKLVIKFIPQKDLKVNLAYFERAIINPDRYFVKLSKVGPYFEGDAGSMTVDDSPRVSFYAFRGASLAKFGRNPIIEINNPFCWQRLVEVSKWLRRLMLLAKSREGEGANAQ